MSPDGLSMYLYSTLTNDDERVLPLRAKFESPMFTLGRSSSWAVDIWAGVPRELFSHAFGQCCLDCALLSTYLRKASCFAACEMLVPQQRVLK